MRPGLETAAGRFRFQPTRLAPGPAPRIIMIDLSALAAVRAPVRLLQAAIDRLQGRAVGGMLIAVEGDGTDAEAALRASGAKVERIGYVAADD